MPSALVIRRGDEIPADHSEAIPSSQHSRVVLRVLFTMALLIGACGDDGATTDPRPPDPRAGKTVYEVACIACHAPGGEGIQGLGKPLANSEFIWSRSDDELFAFIVAGRGTADPENTSGIAMPPRGGRPNLSAADIFHVIAYLRTLQGPEG